MSHLLLTSSRPYRDTFDGLAIYCSDGRFGCHMDEFMGRTLGLSQYDRLVVPGGAARLAGHEHLEPEFPHLNNDVYFLIEAHDIKRVVLIAHQGCAFYTQALGVAQELKEELQKRDLARAAADLLRLRPSLQVDAFFASMRSNRIAFEEVRLELPASTF